MAIFLNNTKTHCSVFFNIPVYFIFFVVVVLSSSCTKEFELNGEWKEIPVIYCLLNSRDTAQYIRVQKAFLADDPYPCLRISDSIYYPPDQLHVTLQMLDNGKPYGDLILCYPSFDFTKEEGDFTTEGHYVFKTTERIQGNKDYEIIIENLKTGKIAKARTTTMGNYDLDFSFNETRYYNRAQYPAEIIKYHSTLNPAFHEMRIVRFLYLEIKDGITTQKYVNWIPQLQNIVNKSVPPEDTAQQFNKYYYKYLSENILPDQTVKRIAIGVDLQLLIGNRDLFVYMELAQRPDYYVTFFEYTNIENGYGIFSSRYNYPFFAQKLKPETLDSLAYGRYTHNLRFADSEGNWH